MQMESTKKAMEYITTFIISLCKYKKYKYPDVLVLSLGVYSQLGFLYRQMNVITRPFRFICFCYVTMFQ